MYSCKFQAKIQKSKERCNVYDIPAVAKLNNAKKKKCKTAKNRACTGHNNRIVVNT